MWANSRPIAGQFSGKCGPSSEEGKKVRKREVKKLRTLVAIFRQNSGITLDPGHKKTPSGKGGG